MNDILLPKVFALSLCIYLAGVENLFLKIHKIQPLNLSLKTLWPGLSVKRPTAHRLVVCDYQHVSLEWRAGLAQMLLLDHILVWTSIIPDLKVFTMPTYAPAGHDRRESRRVALTRWGASTDSIQPSSALISSKTLDLHAFSPTPLPRGGVGLGRVIAARCPCTSCAEGSAAAARRARPASHRSGVPPAALGITHRRPLVAARGSASPLTAWWGLQRWQRRPVPLADTRPVILGPYDSERGKGRRSGSLQLLWGSRRWKSRHHGLVLWTERKSVTCEAVLTILQTPPSTSGLARHASIVVVFLRFNLECFILVIEEWIRLDGMGERGLWSATPVAAVRTRP